MALSIRKLMTLEVANAPAVAPGRVDYSSPVAVSPVSTPSVKPPRLVSVDMLRGIIMVIMALDHVRDYFTNVHFDPIDLTQTTVALFFTRWITHFCARVVVFLAERVHSVPLLAASRSRSSRDSSGPGG